MAYNSPSTGGGGGSPGGADTNIQYNNSSSFGGSANFTWNDASSVLTVSNGGTSTLQFDGTTPSITQDVDGTKFNLAGDLQEITFYAPYDGTGNSVIMDMQYTLDGTVGFTEVGDISNSVNGTKFRIDDQTQTIDSKGTIIESKINSTTYGGTLNYAAGFAGYSSCFFSGSTGASTVLLPTAAIAPIGTKFVIKDLDAIASTSNITVDAGSSNTINGSTIAQTYVMNVNGQSLSLRKVTNEIWSVE